MSNRTDKAQNKYRHAADQGDRIAQFELGHANYLDALETEDYREALKWIHRSAAQQYHLALAHLGYMCLHGDGGPVDPSAAKDWFHKAAEQGHAFDQFNYATMCWNGNFGPCDVSESEAWWLKAADQGDAAAHFALAQHYSTLQYEVASRDFVKAYMWYTLAALQDEPGHSSKSARTARDSLSENMTPQQVAEAESRVQDWLDQHPNTMDQDVTTNWRKRIAEPLTLEEIEEADRRMQQFMESQKG